MTSLSKSPLPKRLAITGSIGMGKSTVATMFEDAGVPVFDADAIVRKLQRDDSQLIASIGERFPGTVAGGLLDREALARAVLGAPRELAALEALVHPEVEAARQSFVDAHKHVPALLFDIPLLFETGGQADFDKVIVVSAPAEIQRRRVMARPGMTQAKYEAILARQMPDEQKRKLADFIVDTGGDLSTTQEQVREILYCLGLGGGR